MTMLQRCLHCKICRGCGIGRLSRDCTRMTCPGHTSIVLHRICRLVGAGGSSCCMDGEINHIDSPVSWSATLVGQLQQRIPHNNSITTRHQQAYFLYLSLFLVRWKEADPLSPLLLHFSRRGRRRYSEHSP
jgi:hypothetical protein